MRFAACLKKDLRLLTGGGLKSLLYLLLPVALVFLMLMGMRSVANADVSVQPFDIAVRDEDGTVMSRLLITQLDHVSIFKSVVRAGQRSDGELAEAGCAAIVTIPKDFFYDLYDMLDTDVVIALNADMPYEAAMVRSALSSIIGILEENQRAHYAAARVRFGELDDERMREVYHDYSTAAAEDALSRLDYLEIEGLYERGYDSQKLFFTVGILSMIVMFMPLCMLRSVSEETEAGLFTRYSLTGGSVAEALLSKFVISLTAAAIPAAALILILRPAHIGTLIPVLFAAFTFSFCFFLFIGIISKKASAAQLAGNLIILFVLTLGGALYPVTLAPKALQAVSRFMLPQIISRSMQYAAMGRSTKEIVLGLWPLAAAALVFFAASLPFFKRRQSA